MKNWLLETTALKPIVPFEKSTLHYQALWAMRHGDKRIMQQKVKHA